MESENRDWHPQLSHTFRLLATKKNVFALSLFTVNSCSSFCLLLHHVFGLLTLRRDIHCQMGKHIPGYTYQVRNIVRGTDDKQHPPTSDPRTWYTTSITLTASSFRYHYQNGAYIPGWSTYVRTYAFLVRLYIQQTS